MESIRTDGKEMRWPALTSMLNADDLSEDAAARVLRLRQVSISCRRSGEVPGSIVLALADGTINLRV